MSAPLTLAPWQTSMTLPATTHPTNMPPPRQTQRLNQPISTKGCYPVGDTQHQQHTAVGSTPAGCIGQCVVFPLVAVMQEWTVASVCPCISATHQSEQSTTRLVLAKPQTLVSH